jgi:poly(3-hydroxybutyrate) depolymerase
MKHAVPFALALAACHGDGVDADAGMSIDSASTDSSDDDACGTRTGMRGLTQRSVMIGSTKRTYLVYLPIAFDATTPLPFVYVFHGFTQSGQKMVDITQYETLAAPATHVDAELVLDGCKPALERAEHARRDARRVPVHAHHAAERRAPRRARVGVEAVRSRCDPYGCSV